MKDLVMKNLVLTITLTLASAAAFAQSSVVIESGNNNTSRGKTDNIENRVNDDLQIIKNKAEDWNKYFYDDQNSGTENSAMEKLDKSKTQIDDVLDILTQHHKEFLINETDPNGGSYQVHATKPVPVCEGDTPRLIYKNNQWRCAATINCGDVTEGSGLDRTDWIQNPDGTCVRQQGAWKIGNWGNCSGGTQSRSVKCVREGSSSTIGNNNCSNPKPLASRTCAEQ